MKVLQIVKKNPVRQYTQRVTVNRNANEILRYFVSCTFLQMLEMLESELSDTFDGVQFWYKGNIGDMEFTGKNAEEWTTQIQSALPNVRWSAFTLNFSIYCSMQLKNDVKFWGVSCPLDFIIDNKEWKLKYFHETMGIKGMLPISSKRLILRNIYCNMLDDYNNNY